MSDRGNETNPPVAEPVAVLGVGVEGRATIDYLLRNGVSDVTALDRRELDDLPGGVKSVFGEEHDKDLDRFATIFRSPGIRPDHPSLVAAREAGASVTSAVSHFLAHCPAPVIGVTGTVGKGTAASLTAAMLEESGFTTHLGGNIGRSPLEFLDQVRPEHRAVLEISSFQAMDTAASPSVAVILKTTSEHLDWHLDHDEYIAAKASLLAHQGPEDLTIHCADAEGSARVAAGAPGRRWAFSIEGRVDEGMHLAGDRFVLRREGRDEPCPLTADAVALPGRFNLENVAAALASAVAVGADLPAACRAAERFTSLPHRLELVTEAGGVRFVNDSYATRPDAALAAIGCHADAPLALILGGSEKNADFRELARAVVDHPTMAAVVLIGATAPRLAGEIERAGPPGFPVETAENLEPAMESALAALPERGGTVLLAPACASFGLFPNYKVRGERFRAKALDLAGPSDGGSR